MTKSQCEAIELDNQKYEREKSIGKRTQIHRVITLPDGKKPIEVNFETERMEAPHQGRIR